MATENKVRCGDCNYAKYDPQKEKASKLYGLNYICAEISCPYFLHHMNGEMIRSCKFFKGEQKDVRKEKS